MNQAEFENKWLRKKVKPLGKHYQIPIKEYVVTGALLEYEANKVTIFAIMALDYSTENKHWFTMHIAPEDMHWLDEDFEII